MVFVLGVGSMWLRAQFEMFEFSLDFEYELIMFGSLVILKRSTMTHATIHQLPTVVDPI